MVGVAVWASAGGTAAAGLVARVAGGGILVDGSGFYGNEMVQLIGVRYDGSTLPFGNATANAAGQFTATLPYAEQTLYQLDARGYGSGAHAVGNITGVPPYPVVPPGFPYVTPTYPASQPGAYPSTGYPYTGAPYGGPFPGPGYNYPQAPSGTVLYPAIPPGGDNPPLGGSGFVLTASAPNAPVGAPVVFTGVGVPADTEVKLAITQPDGSNAPLRSVQSTPAGTFSVVVAFPAPGRYTLIAQATNATSVARSVTVG